VMKSLDHCRPDKMTVPRPQHKEGDKIMHPKSSRACVRKNGSWVLIPLLLLVFGLFGRAAWAATITTDFSQDQGAVTYRGSGFLHGLNASTPADALIAPLKPKLMRHTSNDPSNGGLFKLWSGATTRANYDRIVSLGAVAEWVLSDSWYSPGNWPGVGGTTYSTWDSIIVSFINQAISEGIASNLQYDLWNEPNGSWSWGGTQAQWFALWDHTFALVRSLVPNAVIVGPSVSGGDDNYAGGTDWLHAFLLHAKANGTLPNKLSWHQSTVFDIYSSVTSARTYMTNNGISLIPIEINENLGLTYGSPAPGLEPAEAAIAFAQAERAAISGMCKSCWTETGGTDDCYSNTLNGLLISNATDHRSIWWAYKGYADITGHVYQVSTTDANYDGVSGYDSGGAARSVFGNHTSGTGGVTLQYNRLDMAPTVVSGGSVHVNVQTVSNSGESALASPTQVIDADYTVSGNAITVSVSSVPAYGALLVTLTPPASSAPSAPTNFRIVP
jgi:hypothetical protein